MSNSQQPATPEEAKEKLLDQIRGWLNDEDVRPRTLTLRSQMVNTPQGPGKMIQLLREDLMSQITEIVERSPIIKPPGL